MHFNSWITGDESGGGYQIFKVIRVSENDFFEPHGLFFSCNE